MSSQGNSCRIQSKPAAAIIAKLNGLPNPEPLFVNTCYSIAEVDWGFSVVHVYRVKDGKLVYIQEAGGISGDSRPVGNIHGAHGLITCLKMVAAAHFILFKVAAGDLNRMAHHARHDQEGQHIEQRAEIDPGPADKPDAHPGAEDAEGEGRNHTGEVAKDEI